CPSVSCRERSLANALHFISGSRLARIRGNRFGSLAGRRRPAEPSWFPRAHLRRIRSPPRGRAALPPLGVRATVSRARGTRRPEGRGGLATGGGRAGCRENVRRVPRPPSKCLPGDVR